MSERILIQFKASGDKKLQSSMLKLAAAQGLLEKNTKEMRRAMTRLTHTFEKTERRGRLLNNTFATLRSKMLLFSFAMSLGGRQLIEFGKQAATVEAMGTAFTNLAGGGEEATIMITALKEATNGAMSEMDLFQQANNAMILGITKNSDEMAEMFDMAQRLGKALGRDTASSVESLITGIGRQSRLMLDNIGIIVKTEKAYEKYASKLGITSTQLTDSQKRQAFLNATLEAARNKLKNAGEEVSDNQQKWDEFNAAMADLGVKIGQVVNIALIPLIEGLTKLATALDVNILKVFTAGIGAATAAWGIYIIKQNLATASLLKFNKALLKSGWGAALLGLGAIVSLFSMYGTASKGVIDTNKEVEKSIKDLTLASMKEELQQLQSLTTKQKVSKTIAEKILKRDIVVNKNRIELLKEQIALQDGLNVTAGEFANLQDKYAKEYSKTIEARRADIELRIKEIEENKNLIENEEKRAAVLKNLRKQLAALAEEEKTWSGAINSALLEGMNNHGKYAESFGKMLDSMAKKIMARAGVFAIMNIFTGGTFQGGVSFLDFVRQGIFHQGGQVQGYNTGGLIPLQGYASGGGVDNVPIMAQEGEYVVRRDAVDSIGVENLNRMNRTGQASGGVNITFSGNVLSRDFIEDEAIPMIKNAIRKGADIGIS